MRAKSMVLILIAAVCGLVASIGISQVMDANGKGGGLTETEKIYVALQDIDVGTKLDEKHVRLESWPKDKIRQGTVTKLEDFKDKYPRVRFFKDEPILTEKLSDHLGGVIDKIPEGYRVVPVKVSAENATGLITPGDCVDVIVFLRKSPDVPVTGTKTVLTNVRVFAVGTELERSVDKDGKAVNAQTISLLVTPKQVQKVMMAVELGRIQLSLRSASDKDTPESVEDEGTKIDEFFKDESSPGIVKNSDSPAPPNNNSNQNLGDFLKKLQQDVKPTALPTGQDQGLGWMMEVHTPEGIRYLQWENPLDVPKEVGPSAATAKTLATQKLPADPRALIGTNIEIGGRTLKGKTFDWQEYRGKNVVVLFWATWCAPCRGELPLVKTLQEGYKERGLEIVAISMDKNPTDVSRFLLENQINWPTLVGTETNQLAANLGVQSIPTMLLIDTNGRLSGVANRVSELLPQLTLIYGQAPQGMDLNTLVPAPTPHQEKLIKEAVSDSGENSAGKLLKALIKTITPDQAPDVNQDEQSKETEPVVKELKVPDKE